MSDTVNSDGIPVDQDGEPLEFGAVNSRAPFAIRSDVFAEVFSGHGRDSGTSHLEVDAEPIGFQSSLRGGIPLAERVEIEDVDGYSSAEPLSPVAAANACQSGTSATIHAILRSSKQEREELLSVRSKLMDILMFLKKKGYSEEEVYGDLIKDGFGSKPPARDDFGLPKIQTADKVFDNRSVKENITNPFVDKLKGQLNENKVKVMPEAPEEPPKVKVNANEPVAGKSWSQIVSNVEAALDYCPLPEGSTVVCPPDEELKKGLEKFKWCIVGHFSKGVMPLNSVSTIAHKLWGSKGLLSVMQKNSRTFIFKFNSLAAMNSVLAHGTWYLERKPMIVSPWGKKLDEKIEEMPIWVKLSDVPDCYWTKEGISRLASVIGKPLFADKLTSKFETLPFAKVCVNYRLGTPLPASISAITIDPLTEEKITATVSVTYPSKLMICSCCHSLGHLPGACPVTKRVWVQKQAKPSPTTDESLKHQANACGPSSSATLSPVVPPVKPLDPVIQDSEPQEQPPAPGLSHDVESPWVEVKKRGRARTPPEEDSPTPLQTFKGLKNVDEVEIKKGLHKESGHLSKNQLKRLRRKQGSSSPPTA